MRWSTAGDAARWAEEWVRTWSGPDLLAPGREVVRLPEASSVLRRPCCEAPGLGLSVPPGGRIVLVVRAEAEQIVGADWLTAWAGAGLLPEIAHECDPVPGDPAFGPHWLRAHAVPGADGRYALGCALGSTLTAEFIAQARFAVVAHGPLLPRYFPLAAGDRLPLPVHGDDLTGPQVATAFGLAPRSAAAWLSELVWAGVLRVIPDSLAGHFASQRSGD